ncbi:small nuclear ribonucleoprotein E, partial [Baffinella frigidus]
NLLFRFLQNNTFVSIFFQGNMKNYITGFIVGFDEFMNLVLDKATEIDEAGNQIHIGKILLKGDCISLISEKIK